MKAEIEKLPKKTIKAKVTVPSERVKLAYDEVVSGNVKEVEVPGFRKGNAPKELAEKQLDRQALERKALERVLNESVGAVIKEHLIQPITQPKIEVHEFGLDKDLVFTATLVERPEIKIGDYKKALEELKNKKSETILGPDGTPLKPEKDGKFKIDEAIDSVLNVSEIEIPDLLIEEEINRMLARLVDQTSKLGITIEDYLKSNGKSADSLRSEYHNEAETNLKIEFMLAKMAELENIKVEEGEINATINMAPDEQSKNYFGSPEGRLYVTVVLRNNKTVNKLMELAGIEGTKGENEQ